MARWPRGARVGKPKSPKPWTQAAKKAKRTRMKSYAESLRGFLSLKSLTRH